MKRLILLIATVLVLLTSCDTPIRSEDLTEPTDESGQRDNMYEYNSDGEDDVYIGGKYSDPEIGNTQKGTMQEYTFAKNRAFFNITYYINVLCFIGDETDDVNLACLDVTCDHLNNDCVLYMLRAHSMKYIADRLIATLVYDSNGRTAVVEIDLDSHKKKEIYNTAGSIQDMFGIGRFLYVNEDIEKDGDIINRYVRIDLENGKAVLLKTPEPISYFHSVVPYNGRLYCISGNNEIWSMNAALSDQRLEVSAEHIKDYAVRDGLIYFISCSGAVESQTIDYNYTLLQYDTDTKETVKIKEDVVNFSLFDDYIYYSVYDPVCVGTVTNYRADPLSGNEWIENVDAYVSHGNKIYEGELSDGEITDTGNIIAPPDGYYFEHEYNVHNGYLYTFLCSIEESIIDDGAVYSIVSGKSRISLDMKSEYVNLDELGWEVSGLNERLF